MDDGVQEQKAGEGVVEKGRSAEEGRRLQLQRQMYLGSIEEMKNVGP